MAANSSGLGKRLAVWALAALLFVFLVAWIHGGEEPLHTITEPVTVSGFGDGGEVR